MNKQLAKSGTTLNKNMTNMESLSLSSLEGTNASMTSCTRNYIKMNELSCTVLDTLKNLPTTLYVGTTYYNVVTQSLNIYDGTHWYHVTLTQVP